MLGLPSALLIYLKSTEPADGDIGLGGVTALIISCGVFSAALAGVIGRLTVLSLKGAGNAPDPRMMPVLAAAAALLTAVLWANLW